VITQILVSTPAVETHAAANARIDDDPIPDLPTNNTLAKLVDFARRV
jgi:hypothetical protein